MTAETASLRQRLAALRADLVERLAAEPHLDAGMLHLLGDVGGALAAIDAMPADDELARLDPVAAVGSA